jgi:hypothetical protein
MTQTLMLKNPSPMTQMPIMKKLSLNDLKDASHDCLTNSTPVLVKYSDSSSWRECHKAVHGIDFGSG